MASAAVACIQASGLFPSASHPFWQLTVDAVTSRCAGPSPAPVVESSSSSSEEEDETGPPSDSATPTNPLAALPDAQAMADYLVSELAEQPALGEKFRKSAEILGPDKLWELLLLTGQKIRDNDPIMIDQKGKKRTGGGVFLQLLKPVEAQLKRKREVPQENPGSQRPRLALRPYQAEAVKAIESQRPEKRNWVVAAPTNSGKTAIFVTVARNLLAKKPAAKVVVVVPTLALLDQQSRAFENNGGFRMAQDSKFRSAGLPVVDWFCGDKPFPPSSGPHSAWDDELEHLSVLVFEANTFLNLLKRDASGHVRARMADVDLLVLDECHHCSKEHPYAGIMGYYFASPKKPQVLGLSASPANARKQADFDLNLKGLCRQMGNAELFVISEDDPDVKKVAPTPKDHTIFCPVRQLDTGIVGLIHLQMYKLASDLGKALFSAARSSGSDDCADAIGSFVAQLPPAEKVWINQTHSYNLLCLWLRKAIQLAASWKLFQFGVGVELLEALRKAAALSEDMGYECGIRYVLEMLVMKTLKSKQKRGALAARKKAVPNTGSLAAHPGQRQSTSSTGATRSEQASLAALRAYIHHGPSPAEKQAAMNGNAAAAAANRMGLEGLLAMEPCPDVYPGCVLSMAQKIIAAVQEYADGLGPQKFGFAAGTGSSCLPAAVVRPFLPGGLQRPPATFWKLWSLLQCLHEYSSADNLHAIIFTRTRQGANHLAKALQNAMRCGPRGTQAGNCDASAGTSGAEANAILLRPAAVHVLVGHGEGRVNAKRLPHEMVLEQHVEEEDEEDGEEEGSSSGRGHGLSLHNDQHGMSVAQQRAVVDAFKAGGRNLLVATTAAEEGLDVPSCELVLRYSPPASGTQQVQSRGRGRKEDAQYVCLVQNGGVDVGGGSDHALHYKSKQEEAVLRLGLRSNSTKQGFLS